MSDAGQLPGNEPPDRKDEPGVDHVIENPPEQGSGQPRRSGGRLFGLAIFVVLAGALSVGARNHYSQQKEVMETSAQHRDLVPSVKGATVKANSADKIVSLPATTSAFATANIFARASGYIEKRNVDIGDHVKAGDILAQITAPELDHQIAEAEASLVQDQANLRQAQASADLAQITDGRDRPLVKDGWLTRQQGDTDRLTVQAQQAAVGVAQATVAAQEALLRVLHQDKDYQSVVAPFNGVITQRNIDVGALVQADASSGTFMFNIMQSDVIRVQVFVPQDEAFGLGPGVKAVVRVPEIPDRAFPGEVTRIADALQPGTRTLLTEIDVPNPDGALSPGIYCTAELHIPPKTPSFTVPADAIVFDSEGVHVAVVENGTVHIRKVTVARDEGTHVEVRDGVKDGDQVILNPAVDITEGSKVQIRADAAKPVT